MLAVLTYGRDLTFGLRAYLVVSPRSLEAVRE